MKKCVQTFEWNKMVVKRLKFVNRIDNLVGKKNIIQNQNSLSIININIRN